MLPPDRPAGRTSGHSVSQWTDSTRDRLPNSSEAGGGTPSSDCNAGRSEPPYSKGDRVDQGELQCQPIQIANTAVSSANRRCGIFGLFARQALRRWSRSVFPKDGQAPATRIALPAEPAGTGIPGGRPLLRLSMAAFIFTASEDRKTAVTRFSLFSPQFL